MTTPRRQLRVQGARSGVVIAIISIVWIALPTVLIGGTTRSGGSPIGLMTLAASLLLAGAAIGWLWAPLTRTTSRVTRAGVVVGVAASLSLLGALCVSLAMWISAPSEPGLPWTGSPLMIAIYWIVGLALLGVPSLLATLPMALAWLGLVDGTNPDGLG